MSVYSSNVLGYMNKYCAKALDCHENGQERDREDFQCGIASHAVLQEVALKQPETGSELETVADATVKELLANGRSFNGVHEPPMSPDDAFAGRDLAVEWVINNGMPDGSLMVERGMAIDIQGNPVPYDSEKARYRAVFDLNYDDIEGDEDYSYPVRVVRDYKSAWPANEDELETLQRKGQAVITWRNKQTDDEWIAIRLEICNLRTGMTHTKTIMLDEVGENILKQWEKDILITCNAADGKREARPGSNCLGCPWVLSCEDAIFSAAKGKGELAIQFAAAQARRDELFALVKKAVTGNHVTVPGGTVGYKGQNRKVLREDGHRDIARYWGVAQGIKTDKLDPSMVSLIKALGCGSTQINNMAKVLYPGRGTKSDREAFVEEVTEIKTLPQFGVWKN